jgi:hypothetical protein
MRGVFFCPKITQKPCQLAQKNRKKNEKFFSKTLDNSETEKFICPHCGKEIEASLINQWKAGQLGRVTSEKKAIAARENAKKPRPRKYEPEKGGKLEARVRNKKGREGFLRAVPGPLRYTICVQYDGAKESVALKPEFQPKPNTVPDVEAIAVLAGFELI